MIAFFDIGRPLGFCNASLFEWIDFLFGLLKSILLHGPPLLSQTGEYPDEEDEEDDDYLPDEDEEEEEWQELSESE